MVGDDILYCPFRDRRVRIDNVKEKFLQMDTHIRAGDRKLRGDRRWGRSGLDLWRPAIRRRPLRRRPRGPCCKDTWKLGTAAERRVVDRNSENRRVELA